MVWNFGGEEGGGGGEGKREEEEEEEEGGGGGRGERKRREGEGEGEEKKNKEEEEGGGPGGEEKEGEVLQEREISWPGTCVSPWGGLPSEGPWFRAGKSSRASQRKMKTSLFRETHIPLAEC